MRELRTDMPRWRGEGRERGAVARRRRGKRSGCASEAVARR
uniref:Bifunctional 3-phosphoadenosine 5-phosphosulfate synthetase 2 n=1 Tax=Arundo donax TaxID=35708 RepID=A0A0A9EUL5_ARUDO